MCTEASQTMVGVIQLNAIAKGVCASAGLEYCPKKFALPNPLDPSASDSKIRIKSWADSDGISAKAQFVIPTRTATARVQLDRDNLSAVTAITVTGLKGSNGRLVYQKTSASSTSSLEGDIIVWRGVALNSQFGSATFVQSPGGEVSGSFTTATAALSLDTLLDGSIRIKATLWNDFLPVQALEVPPVKDHGGDELALVGQPGTHRAPSTRVMQGLPPDIEGPVIDILMLITNRGTSK